MGRIWAVVGCLAALCSASGQPSAQTADRAPLVRAALVAERTAAKPGETLTVALRQTIAPGWHTYWQNPGDSGEPTAIDWKLPSALTAGPIKWPLPEAIPVGPLANYGYSDEVLLLTDITIPQSMTGGSVTLAADVRWLVCKEICVPEESAVTLTLPLIDGALSPRRSPDASAIAATREALPRAAPWPARYESTGKSLTLRIDSLGAEAAGVTKARFFPLNWGQVANAAPQQARFANDGLSLRLERGDLEAQGAASLDGILALERPGPDGKPLRRGYIVSAAAVPPSLDTAGPAEASGISFATALVFALLGGLILNLMPCVFPVLSLKAYSLAQEATSPRARRTGGLAYLSGVLVSCAVLGAILVALRAGGIAIGWGMQFQSPAFVLAIAALFLALGLNMSGVFTFGGALAGAGDGLTRKPGLAGYFFTGVLATVVATPCTAPFMGAAIGYAFTQPALLTFAVLLVLGIGFAAPIVLLSLSPALGRLLPKPGGWMNVFKQFMAFPLYATAAWLVWVLSVQQGSEGVLAAMITLLGVAFAAWLFGLPREPGPYRATAAVAAGVAALALGITLLSGTPPATAVSNRTELSGPPAEAFTQARLAALRGERKAVFVNLTAAWCITCKVNERVALNSERIARAFAERGVVYLKGDWTKGDPEITALLQSFGRIGVPLYLLYRPGPPETAPQILPQFLTESMVLGSLADLPSASPKQAKGEF